MSSSTADVCFNSNCKEASEKWRRGWRRRDGEYAHLCDRCASAYEDGKFCETFHLNASGWRCCESCGKQIHCGCIVSFHMFVLLDAGGIECLTCARKSYILTPNPAWPPPLHFIPSQPERMKRLSVKNWSAIAGSGPVPWHQAPTLLNGSDIQANVQLRVPLEIDISGGSDRHGFCERLSAASTEIKQECSFERLINGKWRLGLSGTLQNVNTGLSVKEPHCPFSYDFKPAFPKNDSCSSIFNLGSACSSKIETDDASVSAILSQPPSISIPRGKQVCSQSGIDSSGEAPIRNGKFRGDGRSRNQLLPRYRPQTTDEELQQISSDSKSVITPLFEKMLSASDAGRIGRLVLPKKCAEAYLPQIDHPEGLPLKVQDVKGKEWIFQFRFWPNNNSRMYVLEGITPCIQSMQLQAGDIVTFSRLEPEGKLVMGGRKASAIPSLDQGDEVTVVGGEASTPGDNGAGNKSGNVISVNGRMKERILEDKPNIHGKRKNSNLSAKSKRLRIENDDIIELKLTWKEAQRLMRAPATIVPSSFVVEGCEFEEFEFFTSGSEMSRSVWNKNHPRAQKFCEFSVMSKYFVMRSGMRLLSFSYSWVRYWASFDEFLRGSIDIPSTETTAGCVSGWVTEYEGAMKGSEPVIGRPTILGIDRSGEKTQWVQCEDCFKWRKVPADALVPSRWTCPDNVWNIHRSQCSSAEELTKEQLEKMLPSTNRDSSNKEESPERDTDMSTNLEGLDALANLAIQGEGDGLVASFENRTKHPRHKPGCMCIVCLQPSSGKGSKHKESCDCVVCCSLKRRFRTLMERRERKQLEKEAESSSHNLESGQSSLNQEDMRKWGYLDEPNGRKSSKGQIDLNIQPEREDDLSPSSVPGPVKCSEEGYLKQRRLS